MSSSRLLFLSTDKEDQSLIYIQLISGIWTGKKELFTDTKARKNLSKKVVS